MAPSTAHEHAHLPYPRAPRLPAVERKRAFRGAERVVERSAPRRDSPLPSSIPLPSLTSSAVSALRSSPRPVLFHRLIVAEYLYLFCAQYRKYRLLFCFFLRILLSFSRDAKHGCSSAKLCPHCEQPEQPQSSEKVVKAILLSTQYNCISITMDYKTSLTFMKHVLYCS